MKDLGERRWDFSWARTKSQAEQRNLMRWRDVELAEDYFCTKMVSGVGTKRYNAFLDGEGERDHLIIHTRLVLDEEQEVVYLFPPTREFEDIYELAVALPDSHYRICARLAENDMRCRDERTNELRHVKGFRGKASLNWKDGQTRGGTHIFHDGPNDIGADGWAHTHIDPEFAGATVIETETVGA